MVRRVIGIPDSNGIIYVSCGVDTIEIQIASPPPPPGSQPIPTGGSGPNPFGNPFDLPNTYMRVNRVSDGSVDTKRLADALRRQFADSNAPDPSGVVVSTHDADLHDLHTLLKEIDEVAPGLPVAVDFRKS